jgi:hypothetical protein
MLTLAMLSFIPLVNSASATVLYNEAINGEAGVDPSSAALGTIPLGQHQIIGGNLNFDTDDYAFTIGAGNQLDALIVDSYTNIGSAAFQSPVLGNSLLNSSSVGKNFFALANIPAPLSSGNYVFRATTGTGGPTTYQYSFQVNPVPAPATIRYSESVSGDAPAGSSFVDLGSLTVGSNRISGVSLAFDTDDYSFTVPAGFQVDTIKIETYGGSGSAGLQSPALGSSLLTPANFGQDFLDIIGASQPLGPGTYLFRTTTGSAGPTSYRYDLQLSPVAIPEPGTLGLLATSGLAACYMLRRRRRHNVVEASLGNLSSRPTPSWPGFFCQSKILNPGDRG